MTRHDSPITPLPELDDLDLPMLLDGEQPLPPGPMLACYRPDGTRIDLPLPQAALVGATIPFADRRVARSTRFRRGRRLVISTIFLTTDHQYRLGPPLLWETMIFHGGDRHHHGYAGDHQWRYATRNAALAGHRRILQILRAHQPGIARSFAHLDGHRPRHRATRITATATIGASA